MQIASTTRRQDTRGVQSKSSLRSEKPVMQRMNRLAWLVVDGQMNGFGCSLIEFGTESATLSLQGLLAIPDRFSLFVEPDSLKLHCRILQRRGNTVRVAFERREENVRYRDLVRRG